MKIMISGFVAVALTGCLLLCGCAGSGSNSAVVPRTGYFPGVSGANLQGHVVKVPEDFYGKLTLVVTCYVREQQDDAATWMAQLDEMRSTHKDLGFCEMSIIYSSGSMFRSYLDNGWRSRNLDDRQRRSVMTVYTSVDDFCKAVGLPDTRQVVVFLLGPDGRILGRAVGPYDPEKAAALFAGAAAVK